MNEREVIRRLKAFHKGRPLPRGETQHVHIAGDADVLIVAFVRMGGESRPWGIAYGHPGGRPTYLTVAEARNRDLVAEMAARFATVLLRHLRTPGYGSQDPASPDDLLPIRQVWLPNATHLDMLHHMAFAYTFTKSGGADRLRLRALGRACGWLFREAQRPGQQTTIVATAALRQAYTFPAEETRQGHLGFLLAWLGAKGGRTTRLDAALEAEQLSIATSLAPELERSGLERHVEAWGAARKAGSEADMQRADAAIRKLLVPELRRRWKLTEQAMGVLRADRRRVNAGVAQLVEAGVKDQWYQYVRLEHRVDPLNGDGFFIPVETDRNAAAAASRYFAHTAAADLVMGLLVHDDAELFAEAVTAGDAVRGPIVDVRDDAPARQGRGRRATRPVWTIRDESDRQLRLSVGDQVCLIGVRNRTGRIRACTETLDGALEIEVEIEGLKTLRKGLPSPHDRAPSSPTMVGCEVGLIKTTLDQIPYKKASKVWQGQVPGAWLTHARPGGVAAVVADDDYDDVTTVAGAQEAAR